MAEHLRIQSVALGKPMPTSFPVYSTIPAVAPADAEVLSTPDATELDAADAAPPVAESVEPLLLARS
jgi:hypothetical protein